MFAEWWNSLGLITQVFYCIAVPSTAVLLIQTVLMLIGIGDDASGFGISAPDTELPDGVFGDGDISDVADLDGLVGLRIFTVRGIIAFLVVFGWTGAVMNGAGSKLWLTLLVATAGGFAIMILLAVLLRAVMKLKNDGNTDNRNALGTSGKVYLTVPANRSGEGKVNIMLQGSYVERSAVTDDEEPILTGSEVVVVGLSGQTDLVVRKK